MRLVVVADDFGLCESVNLGIVEAHQKGIVTELSLMLGSPGTEHALGLIRKHNIQNVGLHMLLKNWRDTGAIVRRPDYEKLYAELSEAEIAQLVNVELAEFEKVVGRKPSHITSQYGIMGHPKSLPAVVAYAKTNKVPLRQPTLKLEDDKRTLSQGGVALYQANGIRTTKFFFGHVDGDFETVKAQFEAELSTMQDGDTAEMMLHPGRTSDELRQLSSLNDDRERDLKLATDMNFKSWIEARGIEIVGYNKI